MFNRAQILDAFTPNAKPSQVDKQALLIIENAFKDVATDIEKHVPCTPDRTSALRKLLEAKWSCAQAITHPHTHLLNEEGKATTEKVKHASN